MWALFDWFNDRTSIPKVIGVSRSPPSPQGHVKAGRCRGPSPPRKHISFGPQGPTPPVFMTFILPFHPPLLRGICLADFLSRSAEVVGKAVRCANEHISGMMRASDLSSTT